MLSSKTYAVWNLFIGIFGVLMALSEVYAGNYFLVVGFGLIAIGFFTFSGMAWLHKGIYEKHPIRWKPNGEVEVIE